MKWLISTSISIALGTLLLVATFSSPYQLLILFSFNTFMIINIFIYFILEFNSRKVKTNENKEKQ